MTSDPDTYRAVKLLIDQHGADGGLRAGGPMNYLKSVISMGLPRGAIMSFTHHAH